MIKYINVGKIVNTHALKGEVRIISDFEFKDIYYYIYAKNNLNFVVILLTFLNLKNFL